MANFALAFAFMGPHEWNLKKNFTNDPDDPGGATKYGITQAEWAKLGSLADLDGDGDVDADDLKLMDEAVARHFYETRFWIWSPIADDRLAAKLFDIGVNLGPETATCYLQRALNNEGAGLTVDGKLGPKTVAEANLLDPMATILDICALQAQHYKEWVAKKPERTKFESGLLARAMSVPVFAQGASA